MSAIDEIRNERLKKVETLRKLGIDPYPATSHRTHTIADVVNSFDILNISGEEVTLVGRVFSIRGQGAIYFVDFQDGSGKFQAVLKIDTLLKESFDLFFNTVDAGDFVEFTGSIFLTQKGQQSILASSWGMLSKSLLPLPDKFHGFRNEEERFRKRYLDLLTHPDLRDMFVRKEKFWDVIRVFMKEHSFMEVETPTLEITTGGAEALPFKTHHNDYDLDVFLRISVGELWQKRLLSAGFEKTFEIGRTYRNEGTSPNHLQEFTNVEFYMAYAQYEDGMKLVEELYRTIAHKVYNKTVFTYGSHTFDLGKPWQKIKYSDEILRQTGIDINSATEEVIIEMLAKHAVQYEGTTRERLVDTLWKYCRKNISGPVFLIDHPTLVSPLAKEIKNKKEVTQRFQPIIAGTEVGNGYSELNDPLEQHSRFNTQQEIALKGDEEAMMPDQEFIEMLEHGMPPACGFGFGERLFAICENKPLRETQLFPFLRPKE